MPGLQRPHRIDGVGLARALYLDVGANVCRMSWHRPGGGDTVVVLSVEDNLVKGAAGQAVQNMNIMFGLDERLGLTQTALVP